MARKKRLFLLLIILSCAVMGAEMMVPKIHFTGQAPFANGKRIEARWEKADLITGFAVPEKFNVAIFNSEVAMLFDDANLYISLSGKRHAALRAEKMDRGLFADNNFEIILQPDKSKNSYCHFAISESGKTYMANGRAKVELPGVKMVPSSSPDQWRVAVTIPLKDIGLSVPPAGSKKIRFLIGRQNIDLPKEYGPEQSASAVLDAFDYHVPDNWNEAEITRDNAPGVRIPVASGKFALNILANPDYAVAIDNKPVGWGLIGGEVTRMETAPLSGVWMVRATGKTYHFMTNWLPLTVGKDYTMKIRAKKYGTEGSFGIIQLVKKADGGYGEGAYSAWQIPLSENFHEYYINFKPVKGYVNLLFFRLGSKGKDCAVDFSSVKVYEGKVSSFEIRKVDRGGIKRVVPGTAPKIAANPYGMRKDGMRSLAIVGSLGAGREIMELFAGTNVQFDIITTTGKNQDIYYTDGMPDEIKERLKNNAYQLYMIGTTPTPDQVGRELAGIIGKNVDNGAALWINHTRALGQFQPLLKKYKFAQPENTGITSALPYELFVLPEKNSSWNPDPRTEILIAKANKGRIMLSRTAGPGWGKQFIFNQNNENGASGTFKERPYVNAYLARLAYYAAGKMDSYLTGVKREGNKALVAGVNIPSGSKAVWTLYDKNGKKVGNGTGVFTDNSLQISLPEMNLSGAYVITLHLLDHTGAVIDYFTAFWQQKGAELTDFRDLKVFYSGDAKGEFAVKCTGLLPGMSLAWELEDFSGRVLERGQSAAGAENKFTVPLKNVYTNMANLWIMLKKDGKTFDAQRFPLFVQDRDRKRLTDDFTPCIWNYDSIALDVIDEQLEKIGFRAYLIPLMGATPVLSKGMALGGTFLGGGDQFCALYEPVKNVRRPSHGDKKVIESLAARAEKIAQKERFWGPVFHAVCDEPNQVRPGTDQEIGAHPDNLMEYRKRMQQKYGNIAKFNDTCGTNYKSFDELGFISFRDIRKRNNFAEYIEFRNFNIDRWIEAIKIVSDAGKKGNPDSRLSLYNSFGQGAMGGNDYWKILQNGGLDFSHEYTSMVYLGDNPLYNFDEFYRSFRPDLRVWGFTGYFGSPERAVFEPWWFATHRYGGFTWFAANSGVGSGGGGRWLNIVDVPTFAFNEDAVALKNGLEKSALLKGMGKLFLTYDWKPRNVAIFYSHPSLQVSFLLGKETKEGEIHASGKLHDYYFSRDKIYHMLEELLYQYDFVAGEQLAAGKLDSYNVLFLPGIIAMSDSDVRAIRKFAERGGTVVADFPPGEYNELGVKRAVLPLADLPADRCIVLGRIFDDKNSSQKSAILDVLKKAKASPVITSDKTPDLTGREAMHFVHGKMNVYAIIRNFNRGKDNVVETFTFPSTGHLYNVRSGEYLGKKNSVTIAVPNGDAVILGHYPYKITGLKVNMPSRVSAGSDLRADLAVISDTGDVGMHVFHVELLPPGQKNARFHMQRNMDAPAGKAEFVFRMAANDPRGEWTLLFKDILSGIAVEKKFILQ